MKYLLTFFVILYSTFLPKVTKAQISAELDINNIRALIQANGVLFGTANNPGFEVPAGSGKHTLAGSNLWIGATGTSGEQYVAVHDPANNVGQFWAGPVATTYDAAYDNRYNRVWKINKSEIDAHQVSFNQAGYTMPSTIAQWPAHGNVANGEAAHLAPYTDVNNNSVYDPQNGDFPLIPGDQAVFFMMNDSKLTKSPFTPAMGIEVHGFAYSYTAKNNVVFVQYTLINRSGTGLNNLYLGLGTNFDIGNPNDNYTGCDSAQHAFFGFNGDDLDETSLGYGNNPPAQGVLFLNSPMNSYLTYGFGTTPTGSPETPEHYYNYLQGKWKDGNRILYGGNGYDPTFGSYYQTNYHYPGSSLNNSQIIPSSWTERASGNTPGQRRGVGSTGPFSLNPGERNCITIGYQFARNTFGGAQGNLGLLHVSLNATQNFWNNVPVSCSSTIVSGLAKDELEDVPVLYPNPVSSDLYIHAKASFSAKRANAKVLDVTGRVILTVPLQQMGEDNYLLDVERLKPGMYLLEISNGNGSVITRFVKN